MSKKLSLKINNINFADFVEKIQDLSNIDEIVKLKIEQDQILMYSMKANDAAVLAVKNYTVPTSDYFLDFNSNFSFDFIITNTPKFIKSLKFLDINKQIKMDLIYKPHSENVGIMQIRSAQFNNDKLKISSIGGEDSKIRDLYSEFLEESTNLENAQFHFQVSKMDFLSIKKLCAIHSGETDKILSIIIDSGVITASEDSKWELQLGEIDKNINSKIVFNKKYLSNINADLDIIEFHMFENFILVKDEISNLMLSFEQTFD